MSSNQSNAMNQVKFLYKIQQVKFFEEVFERFVSENLEKYSAKRVEV